MRKNLFMTIGFMLALLQISPVRADSRNMSVERLDEIITSINPEVKRRSGTSTWTFKVDKITATVIADAAHDRMRILVAVARTAKLGAAALYRAMQANFDTALDARYAIAKDILWAAYIHPLKSLRDRQFVSALGQTVTLAKTFGSTYSSGGLSFGAGDSRSILKEQLLEILRKKGMEI